MARNEVWGEGDEDDEGEEGEEGEEGDDYVPDAKSASGDFARLQAEAQRVALLQMTRSTEDGDETGVAEPAPAEPAQLAASGEAVKRDVGETEVVKQEEAPTEAAASKGGEEEEEEERVNRRERPLAPP